jgi:glucose-1-phosphate cytidylyltransferase
MAAAGEMMGFRHDGFWQCMDTAREHEMLNAIWRAGEAPWKVWD